MIGIAKWLFFVGKFLEYIRQQKAMLNHGILDWFIGNRLVLNLFFDNHFYLTGKRKLTIPFQRQFNVTEGACFDIF